VASILNIGVSALKTYQQALNSTGHNIANVNTPGYSRQVINLSSRDPELTPAGWLGTGVELHGINRQYDDFTAKRVRDGRSTVGELDAFYSNAQRLDSILADPAVGLSPALNDFFNAMQELADDPASIPSRQLLLAESRSLVERMHDLDQQFADSQAQVNRRLDDVVQEIDRLAESIANANDAVVSALGHGSHQTPNDLLDQRDELINEFSDLVNITTVEQSDGAMNVFIGRGQVLVVGNVASDISTVSSPADASQRDVIFSNDFGDTNISSELDGGELGGLLSFRREMLDTTRNQLGLVALGISMQMNQQHQLGIDLDGDVGGAIFSTPEIQVLGNANNSGGAVTASYGTLSDLTASDYELEYDGGNSYTLRRLSDNSTTSIDTGGASPFTTAEIDGFSLTIDSSGVAQGDSFLIRPSRGAADSMQLLIDDVRGFAAAGRLQSAVAIDASGNPANSGTAVISQPSISSGSGLPLAANMVFSFSDNADGAGNSGFVISNGPAPPNNYILYDPATESAGKSFPSSANPSQFDSFGGLNFRISGTPTVGDQLIVRNNTNAATGDNRNALALAAMQSQDRMLNLSASYSDVYSQLVAGVGASTRQAEASLAAQEGLLERNRASQEEVSGVNLDEEAAKLVQFQQAYQASAEMIKVANSLFDTLLSAVR
jgi:flagellar hook-associated protein 1 FlgK